MCFESFTARDAAIATAASIWRPLAPSPDALAEDALSYLRAMAAGWASARPHRSGTFQVAHA